MPCPLPFKQWLSTVCRGLPLPPNNFEMHSAPSCPPPPPPPPEKKEKLVVYGLQPAPSCSPPSSPYPPKYHFKKLYEVHEKNVPPEIHQSHITRAVEKLKIALIVLILGQVNGQALLV